jgi:hypothetical protein
MKLEKISNNVLYVVCAIIVLCFLAFMFIGYDNYDEAGRVAPKLTGMLLFLQYALGIVTFILMIWSVIRGAKNSGGSDENTTKGVPGKKVILFTSVVTILAFVLGLVFNLGEDAFTTSSGVTTSGTMVTVVDAFMWSIYILFFVAVCAVVLSATGLMTKFTKK